ncbi:Protein kinase superfamily protein [Prunus dulcis]|uniref:mitogen-activated protein kinase kinase kinase n=1 Tax=Prunus dulcis TaxID=3755 RepID=A0A5H2XMP8_PRUDU|nr:Protein kinase superfamily protein [Prunus dulcis]
MQRHYSEMGSLSRHCHLHPPNQYHAAKLCRTASCPATTLPRVQLSNIGRTDSGISASSKPGSDRGSNQLFYLPLPRPECVSSREDPTDAEGDIATASISYDSSTDSDDPIDSRLLSPMGSDYENGNRTTLNSPSSVMQKDQFPTVDQKNSKETVKPDNLLFNTQILSPSPKRRPSSTHMQNIQIPYHGAFFSAPDSSLSSPSRSPMRVYGSEQVRNSNFWAGKPYPEIASAHSSSPGSGQNSGHNSVGGDLSGQLFWQHNRCSPECSPIPSPRLTSPGPSSRIQSGAVTPLHPRAGGPAAESPINRPDDGKQKSHRLPLPPITITNTCPFSPAYSAATTPTVPRSPNRAENPASPGSRWKKGRLLGRGTFGHVYLGFNSESGEMCAMKEVTLFADDAKSKESAQQLGQVDDKLYIYLEYMSGGSIYKLLQEYGQLGEIAIRSYTQQILSGLAYLHAKNTVHRDIKGANILVDPSGRVKLADFGMAKHITGQSCPLSFKGSPYWMAPEVIKNSNGCNLAVDVWSLGCTVLEMATTKPPWSQYEGVAAMFKIGNSKELPGIPDHLSDDGKDFIRLCLQRNPLNRPIAAQLLEHPFVKNVAPLERTILSAEPSEGPPAVRSLAFGHGRNHSNLDSEGMGIHQSRGSKLPRHQDEWLKLMAKSSCYYEYLAMPIPSQPIQNDAHTPRNVSCPVSPIGSPLLHSRSPQHFSGRMSPSPISSPRTTSGSSTPLTGGSGAIPFQHLKQPTTYLHEGMGKSQRSQNCGFYTNGSIPYHEPKPDLFRGIPQASRAFLDIISSDNGAPGDQIGNPVPRDPQELFDVQSILADRVSQQLLRDHIKLNPSMDLNLR